MHYETPSGSSYETVHARICHSVTWVPATAALYPLVRHTIVELRSRAPTSRCISYGEGDPFQPHRAPSTVVTARAPDTAHRPSHAWQQHPSLFTFMMSGGPDYLYS